MAGTLDQDAVEYLRNSGLDINSTNLNWAMDRLATTPGLRPSMRRQHATRTEDRIAMNGGISPEDVLGPWQGYTYTPDQQQQFGFDPVAAANPNSPSSPRSNKNIGGPKAKAPGNPPMPAAKPATTRPTDPNDPATYSDKWWTPENMKVARQGQAEAQYGPGAQVVPGGVYVPGAGAQPAPSNPMQNQAEAGTSIPPQATNPPGSNVILDFLDKYLGLKYDPNASFNDAVVKGHEDEAAVAGMLLPGAGRIIRGASRAASGARPVHPYTRPPIDPGPPIGEGGLPVPTGPQSGPSGGGAAAPKPAPSTPKGGAQSKPTNPNDSFTFGGAPAASEYRVPPKPTSTATPKPANPPKAPSKGEAAADRMMKNSEPRANAKPKSPQTKRDSKAKDPRTTEKKPSPSKRTKKGVRS